MVIKGKKSEKRSVPFEDVTGVSYTFRSETPEFVIHNRTGDLRFKCEYNESDPDGDLLLKLRYLREYFDLWNSNHQIPFF